MPLEVASSGQTRQIATVSAVTTPPPREGQVLQMWQAMAAEDRMKKLVPLPPSTTTQRGIVTARQTVAVALASPVLALVGVLLH